MSKLGAMMAVAAVMLLTGVGRAVTLYNFTYSDPAGNQGYGTVSCSDTDLGNGSFLATDGSFTLTASSDANGSIGTYALIALPVLPGNSWLTPSGLFQVDNLIYPAGSAYGPGSGIYLDTYGVLFGPPGTGSQGEVNIWGNGNGSYSLYTVPLPSTGGYNIAQDNGAFTLAIVPEPAALSLVALGGLVLLCRRK